MPMPAQQRHALSFCTCCICAPSSGRTGTGRQTCGRHASRQPASASAAAAATATTLLLPPLVLRLPAALAPCLPAQMLVWKVCSRSCLPNAAAVGVQDSAGRLLQAKPLTTLRPAARQANEHCKALGYQTDRLPARSISVRWCVRFTCS